MLAIANSAQVIRFSVQGSAYDFLKVGMYPITSMADTSRIASNGLSKNHHMRIEDSAMIKIMTSLSLMSFFPNRSDTNKTAAMKTSDIVEGIDPTPPPPNQSPVTATPLVISQISQVNVCGLVFPKSELQRYGKNPIIPQMEASMANVIFSSMCGSLTWIGGFYCQLVLIVLEFVFVI